MKRTPSSLLLAAALALPALLAQAATGDSIGKVEKVEIQAFGTPPQATRSELQAEEGVVRDELLETVAGGGVSVVFIDGTSFHLGGGSQAKLDEFLFDPDAQDGSIVGLGVGAFRFISGESAGGGEERQQGKVKFSTSTSVIGIRGTDFIVRHEPSGLTKVGVVAGLIEVTSRETGETVEVGPGQYAVLEPGSSEIPVRVAPVRPSDLACWLTRDAYICGTKGADAGTGTSASGGSPGTPGGPGNGPGSGPGGGPGDGPGDGPGGNDGGGESAS